MKIFIGTLPTLHFCDAVVLVSNQFKSGCMEKRERLRGLLRSLGERINPAGGTDRSLARWLKVQNSTVLRWQKGTMQIGRIGEGKIADAIGRTQSEVRQYLEGEMPLDELLDQGPIQSRRLKQILEWMPLMAIAEIWELIHAGLSLIRSQPTKEMPLPEHESPSQEEAEPGLSQAEQLQLLKDFLVSVTTQEETGEYSLAEVAEIIGQPSDELIYKLVRKAKNGSNGKHNQPVAKE